MREEDKSFHALVVSQTLTKYVLHQVHNALGDNGTARAYQCLKQVYYVKSWRKDAETMYEMQT